MEEKVTRSEVINFLEATKELYKDIELFMGKFSQEAGSISANSKKDVPETVPVSPKLKNQMLVDATNDGEKTIEGLEKQEDDLRVEGRELDYKIENLEKQKYDLLTKRKEIDMKLKKMKIMHNIQENLEELFDKLFEAGKKVETEKDIWSGFSFLSKIVEESGIEPSFSPGFFESDDTNQDAELKNFIERYNTLIKNIKEYVGKKALSTALCGGRLTG